MPARENPKAEEKAGEQTNVAPDILFGTDMHKVLSALEQVFSTFRNQLQGEAPKPFTGNAEIAVKVFNDIVAGLKFESRPTALTISATVLSPTSAELRWTDTAGNADGYRVARCEGSDCQDFDEVARLFSSARSFQDFNLVTNTHYRYRVVAFNFRGEALSNIAGITPGTY